MRSRRPFLLVATLCAGLALPGAAWAMRCGNRLVVEGDTAGEVRALCGEPTEVRRTGVLRPPVIWVDGRPVRVGSAALEVAVEIWIYNLGPRRFMRQLRLENGRVVDIDTLGYGYP